MSHHAITVISPDTRGNICSTVVPSVGGSYPDTILRAIADGKIKVSDGDIIHTRMVGDDHDTWVAFVSITPPSKRIVTLDSASVFGQQSVEIDA